MQALLDLWLVATGQAFVRYGLDVGHEFKFRKFEVPAKDRYVDSPPPLIVF